MRKLKTKNYKLKTQGGFSYAELMIVMVLIVITSLGTTLSLIQFYRVQEPRIATRAIAAVLRDAATRSAAQQNGVYWGVRFDNLTERDRYVLFSATTPTLVGYATSSVIYMGSAIQFSEPADSSMVVFDKITGNALIAGCPATASFTVTVSGVSVHIYCNGKIE